MVQTETLAMPAAVYSTVREEYIAATEGVGIADRSHLGCLKMSGSDALDLLNRLSTNRLDDLGVGDAMGTALTTNKGRIIDLLYVLRRDDHLLVITAPDTRQRVVEWIDFYTFIEDVEVEDVTDTTTMLSLLGPRAPSLLPQVGDLPLHGVASLALHGIEATALRTDFAGIEGFDLIVSSDWSTELWDTLTNMGAVGVGTKALELVRLENGIPGYVAELNEDYNPLEAGLKGFISFNKGCYIGQEVVARLNTYDKVQKHLVRLSWGGEDAPELPVALMHEGRNVGTLTSVATALDGDSRFGLGYVRKAHAESGVRLLTEGGLDVLVERIARPE